MVQLALQFLKEKGEKKQADFFWKNKPLRINLQDIAWA